MKRVMSAEEKEREREALTFQPKPFRAWLCIASSLPKPLRTSSDFPNESASLFAAHASETESTSHVITHQPKCREQKDGVKGFTAYSVLFEFVLLCSQLIVQGFELFDVFSHCFIL